MPDMGSYTKQQQPGAQSIGIDQRLNHQEISDKNMMVLQNILINDDSVLKTQSNLYTEKESSSLVKNTQIKSMSDMNSQ